MWCGEQEGFPSSHCALVKQSHHHSVPPFSTGQHLAFHLLALDEIPPLSARDERPWQTSNKLAGRLLTGGSSSFLPKHFSAMDRRISHFSRVHGSPPKIQYWYGRRLPAQQHTTEFCFHKPGQQRWDGQRETVMSCCNGARGPGGRGSRPVDFWATGTVLSDWPGPAGREEEPTLGSLPKIAGEEKRARGKCSVGAPQLESPSSQSASSASARLPHPSFSRPPHHHSTYPSPSPRSRPDHVPVMRVSCPTKSKFDSLRDVCKSA